ncbi:MAG TPA: hypothetical protein VNW94_15205 [Streptosporangiaceae bacterium]|nr:hypothetical protein [Streptosporangiaceae bacterium]
MDFDEAADDLYGVVPDEFVMARSGLVAAARADGDTGLAWRIGALKRPTVSAWAVNQVVRDAAGTLEAVLEIGEGLRRAWAAGADLGDWDRQRSRVVAAAVAAARELAERAGRPLRDQVVREVEDTFQAAIVDVGMAEQVRAGRLVQPLSHVGFVAPGGSAPHLGGEPGSAAVPVVQEVTDLSRRRLRRLAEQAEQKAAAAAQTRVDREHDVEVAQRELDQVTAKVERLRSGLDAAVAREAVALERVEAARVEYGRAVQAAEAARDHAQEARSRAEQERT